MLTERQKETRSRGVSSHRSHVSLSTRNIAFPRNSAIARVRQLRAEFDAKYPHYKPFFSRGV